MGTLYGQLNDTWPVVSWSSRDYFGRWKALHYAAKKAFAPVLVSSVIKGDTVEVWGVSDLMEPQEGTMALELLDFDGTVHSQSTIPVTLAANRSRRLWATTISDVLGGGGPQQGGPVSSVPGRFIPVHAFRAIGSGAGWGP